MSRIVGDALVGGEEANVPEYVTVRLTRGQAEALLAASEHTRDVMNETGMSEAFNYMTGVVAVLRTQIGGPR